MRCFAAIAVFLSVVLTAPAAGTTHVVHPDGSGDFPTIQAAVNAAVAGDVVALSAGVFSGPGNRDIDLLAKAISVESLSGDPATCILDLQASAVDPHRGFFICSGESPATRVAGLTIQRGYLVAGQDERGGALLICGYSNPTIENCVFFMNHAVHGGALYIDDHSSPTISGCFFRDNTANQGGGGASITGSSFTLLSTCTFWNNDALGYGAALNIENSVPTVVDCTLVGNMAPSNGAIGIFFASCILENTIIAFSPSTSGIFMEGGGATLTCCDIYGNEFGDWTGGIAGQLGQNGNISADPLFCDLANGAFTLEASSPCAPAASACNQIGAWPVDCGGTSAQRLTWGGIKAIFLE